MLYFSRHGDARPVFCSPAIPSSEFQCGKRNIRCRTHPLPRGRHMYALCHVSAYILRLPVAGVVSVVHSLQNNTASLPPACARESGCLFPPLYRYSLLRSVQASSACVCRTEALLTLYTFSQSRRVQKFTPTTIACVFARTRMAIATHFCACAERVNHALFLISDAIQKHTRQTYQATITQFVSIQIDGHRFGYFVRVCMLYHVISL